MRHFYEDGAAGRRARRHGVDGDEFGADLEAEGERALGLGQDAFRFHNLPGDYTGTMWSQTYRNYQSYVFVNGTALRALVNQYMNPYLTDITADMQHVSHDTTVNNLPVESDSAGEEATGDGQSASD